MGRRAETKAARSAEELRERIREHLERIPDDQLWRVDHLVRGLVENDRTLVSLASVPEVDVTDEERAAIRAGSEEIARGEGIPLEEVERRFDR